MLRAMFDVRRFLLVSLLVTLAASCGDTTEPTHTEVERDGGRDTEGADVEPSDGGADAEDDAASPDVRSTCQDDGQCDDHNACTDDECEQGSCTHTPADASCDDGNGCTLGDHCEEGACVSGESTCQCQTPSDCAAMDDDDLCNGVLTCRDGSCQVADGSAVTCPWHEDPCLLNVCVPSTGHCEVENVADGVACSGAVACASYGTCQSGQCLRSETCCDDGADNDGDGQIDCEDEDCDGDNACSGCGVHRPTAASEAPLEGLGGRHEVLTHGGFTDDYLYDPTETLKVGTRREWGGSIIFLGLTSGGPGQNDTNVIDANDTGREVQVAFYDVSRLNQGCAYNQSCQSNPAPCGDSIQFLGWNPVQGGNRCNRGSGVESVDFADGVLTLTTRPLHWNPNWDRTDCSEEACDDASRRDRRADVEVIQRLRFVRTHVVEVDTTVHNVADLDHPRSAQEFPTVYTANGAQVPNSNAHTQDLWRLYDSAGNPHEILQEAGGDGFYFHNFSSDGWAQMQNEASDYGVGLYAENRVQQWQAWQKRSLPFNNFRPLPFFAIPAHGTIRGRTYLILGSQDGVATEAQWLATHTPPFGVIDEPPEDGAVAASMDVRGWVLDDHAVASVRALVDGAVRGTLATGQSRPDVCLVFPGYSSCNNVGYSGQINVGDLAEDGCFHLLEVEATDTHGNTRVIARRRFHR